MDQHRQSSSTSGPSLQQHAHSPVRSGKRQKVTRACDGCKGKKRRCTGTQPCTSCVSNNVDCTYTASYTRGRIVQPIPNTDAGHRGKNDIGNAGRRCSRSISSRPASPELDGAALSGRYSGPNSAYSFLRRAWRRFGIGATEQSDTDLNPAVPIFQYGDKQYLRSSETFTFPSDEFAEELFATYFDFSMPTYRFLHRPTCWTWLKAYHNTSPPLLPARQAIILMVLGTAARLQDDKKPEDTEPYFQAAQIKLASETGKLRIESVQARLAMCLYLMHTSRPNQAWYTFGITCQLVLALGMHRAREDSATRLDPITSECRKRAFWSAFTLDTYLSCILGRPALLHSDDVDQDLPASVDDDEITNSGIIRRESRRDSVILASIYHAKVMRIAKKAIRLQYSLVPHSHRPSNTLNNKLAEWKASLPVVLSGKVPPTSLVQIFQRQVIVLELAYSLAVILVNRPLLLMESAADNDSDIRACLSAAKTILDTIFSYIAFRKEFPAMWFTQFVTFNALTIVYIWLLQRKRGRMSTFTPPHTDEELYQTACDVQKYLASASVTNAPGLRYSIILDELHQETTRAMARTKRRLEPRPPRPPAMTGLLTTPTEGLADGSGMNWPESSPSTNSISTDLHFDADIWQQLDTFPFPDFDFDNFEDFGASDVQLSFPG